MKPLYLNLKLSKNGLPSWDSLIPYTLEYVIEKKETTSLEIVVDVADMLELPESLRYKTYEAEKKEYIIENRITFTMSALKIAGLIDNISRGSYKITQSGIEAFKKYSYSLNKEHVESTKKSIEYNKNKEKTQIISNNITDIEVYDIIEEIEEKVSNVKNDRKTDLIDVILKSSPYLFEKMVVDLLAKMGYKGKNGSAFVTKKSHDGGIDGVLNLDALGTQTVYVQAKRYTNASVQRQEIEAFYGALSSIRANRGVFITTSKFSKSAIESAEKFSIILINQIKLVDLLLEYEVGIKKDRVFYTYKLDDQFFSEN